MATTWWAKRQLRACIEKLDFIEFKLERQLDEKKRKHAHDESKIRKLVRSGKVDQARMQARLSVMAGYDVNSISDILHQITMIRTMAERSLADIELKQSMSIVTYAMELVGSKDTSALIEKFGQLTSEMTDRANKVSNMSGNVFTNGLKIDEDSALHRDTENLLNRVSEDYALKQSKSLQSAPVSLPATSHVPSGHYVLSEGTLPLPETKENTPPSHHEQTSASVSEFEARFDALLRE